ncbi:MAG: DUF3068 domain-containing protein [Dermatophilaceae bacterium]
MRRNLGLILMGLSGFLLVTALMGWFYAPGAMEKTPLNVNSETELTGTATYLGKGYDTNKGPDKVRAVSRNVVDGDSSDGDVVVFSNVSCLVWDKDNPPGCVDQKDKRLINASEDVFATDRRTGEAVASDKYTVADDAHSGLINKFPFHVEQKTYPFWDGLLGKPVDATFEGEEELDGYNTYRFAIKVDNAKADIAKDTKGTYSTDKTMWIDPVTGSILKQEEHQVRTLPDGMKALDLKFAFTDDQVAKNLEDARSNASKLGALRVMPWVALGLALLSGIVGLMLARGGRRASDADHQAYAVKDDPTLLDGLDDSTRRRDIHS